MTIQSFLPLKTALFLGASAFALVFSTPASAQMSKEDVQGIVKDYLETNPEVVVNALDAYRIKQQQEEERKAQATIEKYMSYFLSEDSPSVGAEDPKITIVEFFDYNCGYCKRALPDVQAALDKHDDVRAVFQEMPILSPSSRTAAKWALAADKQGKYFEYHAALMELKGNKDEATLSKIATDLGLDVDQIKKDAASKEIEQKIAKAAEAAREIGIQGTPAFIINGTLYRGYLGEDGMQQAIEQEREKLENSG